MFSHVCLGSSDVDRSKQFYDAVFAALGAGPGTVLPSGNLVYSHNGGNLMVGLPLNGEPVSYANGGTIGLVMSSPEQAKAWHDAGIANGGTTCEDPPGVRSGGFGVLYLAYLRDPDGNKLCGVHRMNT